MMLSQKIRAARILLDWNQERLALAACVGSSTVKRMEAKPGLVAGHADAVWKIPAALEAAGVVFIPEDDSNGPGVRLRKMW